MSETQCDDLTVIKGISEARQGRLREDSGLCTLQDLATISDERARSVAERLNGVSADMIKGWRAEAREQLSLLPPSEQESERLADRGSLLAAAGEWKSYASFVVVVQTRWTRDAQREQRIKVHHRETDKHAVWPDEDGDWPGMKSPQPWEWIVAQLGETEEVVLEAEEETPVKPTSDRLPSARVPRAEVKVTDVHAYQPAHARTPVGVGKAGAFFRGTVRGSEPFALEASFELVATNGANVAKEGGTYRAQFYASNRSTGERIYLNSTEPEPLVENQSCYTAKLPSATLPPGNYKLQVLVALRDSLEGLGFLEVPMLQVV